MALPPGRSPFAAGADHVRRYQPPSGCGARSRAAMSHSPGRTAPVCPIPFRSLGRGRARPAPSVPEDAAAAATARECWAEPPNKRAIHFSALHEDVCVMLPGEADAAEGLEALAADRVLAVVRGSLRHGDG